MTTNMTTNINQNQTPIQTFEEGRHATDQLKQFWNLMLPFPLEDKQFAVWLLKHTPDTVKAALSETSVKYDKLKGSMDKDYAVKFASSVMNRISGVERPVAKPVKH